MKAKIRQTIQLIIREAFATLVLSHLPTVGCVNCSLANPPQRKGVDKKCACDDLFLKPVQDKHWVRSKKTWFVRQRRGVNWFTGVMSSISKLAGLEKIYTNSCMRPTVVTEMLTAGYDNRQVQEFTGHKSEGMVQHYSRKLERMKEDEKSKASALTTSSGRRLRREQGTGDKSSKVWKICCNFHIFVLPILTQDSLEDKRPSESQEI